MSFGRARSKTLDSKSSKPVVKPLSLAPILPPVPRPQTSPVESSWRDSVLTNDSSGSSVYPVSSHADSLPTPSSPDTHHFVVHEKVEDDVSYRLRLLVNNNYFLPPAHAKPALSEFNKQYPSADTPKPGFLDLFRGSKRTPPIPEPVIRATSDTVTRPRPRTKSESSTTQRPILRSANSVPPAVPRVAVLREQLPDLSQAALEAAKDMKTRPVPSPLSKTFIDVNPTDCVDVPPPSSNYPFAVQASTLHALTAQESLGADVLAEKLPPHSPRPDEPWRRKLLHAAVGHSFTTTPTSASATTSSYGSLLSPSSPSPSSSRNFSVSAPSSPSISTVSANTKIVLGQPITISSPVLTSPPARRTSLDAIRTDGPSARSPKTESVVPPSTFHHVTPLAPPPRKQSHRAPNPLDSFSQADLSASTSAVPSSGTTSTFTVPDRLHGSLEVHNNVPLSMTPPPPAIRKTRRSMDSTRSTTSPSVRTVSTTTTRESFDDEEEMAATPRRSIALSALRDGRSVSSASPSTWIDGQEPDEDEDMGNDTSMLSYRTARSSPPPPIPPRRSIASPPPRSSISSSNLKALSPPPRQSSLGLAGRKASPLRIQTSAAEPNQTDPRKEQEDENSEDQWQSDIPGIIVQPGPITPPFPTPPSRHEQRHRSNSKHAAPLSAPVDAPHISSSTAFFDSLPTSMTEFEDSSDEEDLLPPPSLTRLGNHSSPHLHSSAPSSFRGVSPYEGGYNSSQSSLTGGAASIKSSKSTKSVASSFFGRRKKKLQKPVGHIAQPAPFFKETSTAVASTSTPYDLITGYSHSSNSLNSEAPRSPMASRKVLTPSDVARASMSSTRGSEESAVTNGKGKKDFDGLFLKHMRNERDVIKRITERNASSSKGRSGLSSKR